MRGVVNVARFSWGLDLITRSHVLNVPEKVSSGTECGITTVILPR